MSLLVGLLWLWLEFCIFLGMYVSINWVIKKIVDWRKSKNGRRN